MDAYMLIIMLTNKSKIININTSILLIRYIVANIWGNSFYSFMVMIQQSTRR